MSHNKLNDISIDKTNLSNDVITECLADLTNNDKNLSNKIITNNLTYNITNYWENKLTNHELEHDPDPDLNFFNNITYPTSKYVELNKANLLLSNHMINSPFNIVHLNCCSMYNKLGEITVLMNKLKIKILAITETWMQSEIAQLINIVGYNF